MEKFDSKGKACEERITDPNGVPLALTVRELARMLGVSKNTAYDLVRSGQLRSIRVGRQIRVPRSAMEDYLNGSAPSRDQPA